MTIELALCLIMMFVAMPFSKSIAAHYFVFAIMSTAFIGVTEVDATLLAIVFALMAVADTVLVMAGGRMILLVTALTSAMLAFESIANQDWLLSQVTYISAITNALIVACIAKEYRAWMRGKRGRC